MDAIKVFCGYARRDRILRDKLEKHLEPLKRMGQITIWYDRQIQPGKDWRQEIENQINTADIILLLLSSNFISSDYCYGQEMQRAIERQRKGDVHIIPIILRPVRWQELPIGNLQALPTNGKPVSSWARRDEAFEDIVEGIHQVVTTYQLRKANQNQSFNIFTDQFLLRMLYEFRFSFTTLSGYLELAGEFHTQMDNQTMHMFLQHAMRSAKEIGLIADWLTQLTLIQRQPVVKELLLVEIAHNVIQSIEQKLQEEHPLHLDIPKDLVIKADTWYVRQILNNLLSNVYKYTPIGTSVSIRAIRTENSGESSSSASQMVLISVKDFGPGIPPDELPLLFEPFQRLRKDLIGKVQGLGLGLYISKQLVEFLGGHLWVDSTGILGEGSIFYFTLPT